MHSAHRIVAKFGTAATTLVMAVALVGCSETTLITTPDSGLPTRVEAIIEVASDHPSDPYLVDFGEVYAGDVREKEVTIRNLGTDTLQVQDLQISDQFEIINQDDITQLLAPDAMTVVRIAYSPLRDEHIEGSLNVASNDHEDPVIPVRLLGEGLAPAVHIDPPSYDFGNPELGCVGQLDITISNVGRAPLQIQEDGIWYEDLGGNGEMTLEHSIPDDTVLDPGESVEAQVHYVPIDVQPDTGILHVETNDPMTPDAQAEHYGIAHPGEPNIDLYEQVGNNQTDILWVVDNSCSMSEEQSSLAANFASFIQIIDAIDVDYHIGVTTTDVADQGELQGTETIITPFSPTPTASFAANVNLGINGAGVEQGLHTAYQALSSPMTDPGGFNDGFLREGAGLRLIFVTDEQDQSGTIQNWSVQDYVSYFQSLKANPEHVALSDISGGLNGCSGGGGSATTGSDFVMATDLTGGMSASICDPNWVSTLSALAWFAQSFADTFELSETPVEDSIEVRIDNVPVFVGWVYDSALQAIVFDVDHVPENDETIEIEYVVLGTCSD
ncbi:MAG TPA: hypothetical protein DIU15_17995 [Deltaproteobacteria bacterium]|nr:hypothetical protein [Deltaproteobacteria bacterium]